MNGFWGFVGIVESLGIILRNVVEKMMMKKSGEILIGKRGLSFIDYCKKLSFDTNHEGFKDDLGNEGNERMK